MSLSLWAHVSVIVLILWNVSLLAAVEKGEFKPNGARVLARIIITLCLVLLIVIWMALP